MNELLIPNPAKYDVVTFNILIDNKEINSAYQLLSLTVLKEVNRIPTAKLVFRDGDAAARKFEISNADDFVPGKKIQVNIGRDGKNGQAFKGLIVRHSHYFDNVRDDQVFDELLQKYKLQSDSQSTKLQHKALVQHHISDWDFLNLRAEANGMLVMVEDGKVRIVKPELKTKEDLQVNYGSSLLEFEAEIDGRTQYQSVQASSWDYSNQQLFKVDSSSVNFTEAGNLRSDDISSAFSPKQFELHHSGHKEEQELQAWSDGLLLRSRLSKVRGRARFLGYAAIKPGDTVKVSGVGDRFNGMVYVSAVRQDIGTGTWETQIQFGLAQTRYSQLNMDIGDTPSAGLAGAINGLQIGKVIQLQNDPDGQDRILVTIPMIDNKAQGIWTRVASLDAGAERGAFFRPEIGDEVIVGFINDDPSEAVVLGMLHSSNKPAPIKAQDQNNEKGFTTRSKMHISFNDDTKTIKIDTPAGNSITLDEQGKSIKIVDQNQNKLTMEPSGIQMESVGKIDIKAGTVLTLSAGVSLAIGGPALSIKADGAVSIKGATATLAASSLNTITGLPVKIN
jgi:Rhs element Vgr protein